MLGAAAISAPTPALIPSRTSSSTGTSRASGMITSGSRFSMHSTFWSLGRRGYRRRAHRGEGGVMRCTPGPRGSEGGRKARPQLRIAHPGAASLAAESAHASWSACRAHSICQTCAVDWGRGSKPPAIACPALRARGAAATAAWNADVRRSSLPARWWAATRAQAPRLRESSPSVTRRGPGLPRLVGTEAGRFRCQCREPPRETGWQQV